jgi:Ca-activated chloride channel family protein
LEFENLWLFLFLILYFICEKFCPAKQIAIYFPHFEYTKKIDKNYLLRFFIIFFTLLALSNPYIAKEIVQINKSDAIVLSIDSSGSMDENNKFEVVKEVASDFIDKRAEDKLGLVVFGTNAFIASPLTKNKKFVKEILNRMYVGVAGKNTAILDSLVQGIRLLKNTKAKTKIIILLTDGVDNSSKVSLDSVMQELKKNIKVYTIGVGDGVNYELLEYIAQQTNGKMFQAYSKKDIQNIYNIIDKLEKTPLKNKIIYKEYLYIYPLSIAFLLLLIYIGRRRW